MKKELVKWSFLMAAGELVYISLVATFMQSGEKSFGKEVGILGPVAFLLLFVFSASLSGAIVLGKPTLLYLEGKKKDAITLFGFTLSWFFVFFLVALFVAVLWK